jgi:hypothetical protein
MRASNGQRSTETQKHKVVIANVFRSSTFCNESAIIGIKGDSIKIYRMKLILADASFSVRHRRLVANCDLFAND